MKTLFLLCMFICNTYVYAIPFYIDQKEIDQIRKNPFLIEENYQLHKQRLIEYLDEPFIYLSDDELFIIHCSLVAYGMAPYGVSNAITLEEMLKSPYLNCGNYPILTVRLAEEGRLYISEILHLPFVAWRGPHMGSHGLLFLIRGDKKDLFIDPTTGIIAQASFDEVAGGKPVELERIKNFGFRQDIQPLRSLVTAVLSEGRLKPSELLYYYHSVDARNRSLPLNEQTATPASQMELFGPIEYLKP